MKNKIIDCIVLLALPALVATASAATLEVGSGQTYSTLNAALNAAVAGDVLNIHAGTYTETTVSISKNNLTLKANGTDTPTLVGRISNGSSSGTTIIGLTVTGWGSAAAGIWGFHTSGATGFSLQNCSFTNGFGTGVYIRNSTNWSVSGCTFAACKLTSAADGTGIVAISGHSTDSTYEKGGKILNCTIHDCEVDGIQIQGQYFTVSGNNVYNNITTNWPATHPDGIQFIAGSADGYTDTQHVRLFNNVFRNHTQNIFVEGSSSRNASLIADINIWNNLVYTDLGTVNGVVMDTLGTKGLAIKYSKGVTLVNNTVGRHGNLGVYIQACADASVVCKNNIINNTFGPGLWNDTPSSISSGNLDYNLYSNLASNVSVKWGSVSYATRALFNAANATMESHGRDGAPGVSSWTSGAIPLSSPAVDAGATLDALFGTDNRGMSRAGSWDIGAFEAVGSPVTLQAASATLTLPFVLNSGAISQPVLTALPVAGRASFRFNIAEAGEYGIVAKVDAPSDAANSFFLNIDAEPQDPNMIWDIPVTSGFESRIISWRGTGTFDANQIVQKFFQLGVGEHELILRGREGDVKLQSFEITKRPRRVVLRLVP